MSYFDEGRRDSFSHMDEDEENVEEIDMPNPFALPPPPVELGSRFDPKVMERQRRESIGSTHSELPRASLDPGRPLSQAFSLRDRRHSQAASLRFSTAELAEVPGSGAFPFAAPELQLHEPPSPPLPSRVFPDIPSPEEYGRPLRPSRYGPLRMPDRRSLLRPKTLIMPSPLSGTVQSPVGPHVPEGYEWGDKPLPVGARSSILVNSESAGHLGLPLSLSQRTFRDSMMVGSTRGEEWIGGAELDGEIGVRGEEAEQRAVDRAEKRPGKLFVSQGSMIRNSV
jgi:hypothetical protein